MKVYREKISTFSIVLVVTLSYIPHYCCISEINVFFQNFVNCLFHIRLGHSWEQNDQWNLYSKILDFYGGVSPFTMQSKSGFPIFSVNQTASDYQDGFTIRKFSRCSIHLHVCRRVRILSLGTGTDLLRSEFVWFLFSSNDTGCNYDDVASSLFTRSGFSALIFGILNFTRVHMICLSCKYINRLTSLSTLDVSDVPHYKKLWKKLHSNLHGKSILINAKLNPLSSAEKWNCNIHKEYVTYAYVCTYLIMMKHLNFTIVHNKSPRLSKIHGAVYTRQIVNKNTRRWLSFNRLNLLGYAMNIKPYEYMIVLDHIPTHLDALLQPFDWLTWICLIVSSFMVAVILFIEFKTSNSSSPLKTFILSLSSACLPTTGLLVDQPASNLSQLMKKHSINTLLWWQWSVVAVTLSQFYKGSLFSFLSNSPPPEVPDLESILKTNTPIFTQSSANCIQNFSISKPCSTLRDSVLRNLLENQFKHSSLDFTELYRSIYWPGSDSMIYLVGVMGNGRFINKKTNTTETLKSFVFIDTPEVVKLFKMQLTFFSGKWTSKAIPMPLFMNRDGWVMRENYLYILFKKVLAQLYESGLYNRWDDFDQKDDIVYLIKKTAIYKYDLKSGSEFMGVRQYSDAHIKGQQFEISLANLFHYVYMNTQEVSSVSETLPTKVYLLIMLYALVCLGLSSVVLIGEMLIKL
ncbi:unnamed protein product [Orchesella dallaii]|uniref:Uncharacterized protein n=1 Tax=Orchesella dallaii TaxID=48710 RepID=A0ABP1QJ69_9HEXA